MFYIVLAEDNPADAEIIGEAIHASGMDCELTTVRSREEFLAYARLACDDGVTVIQRPDLVILDWSLPRGTGTSLVKSVRETVRCKDAPIFILTSSISPREREEALKSGATKFLTKPNQLEELFSLGRLMRRYLEGDVVDIP